jgi:hypothetical protein
MTRGSRIAFAGSLVAMAIVHAMVAFWTPVQGDDWIHWVWHGEHVDAGIGRWLAAHWTLSDAIGYALARERLLHVILTPAIAVLLVIGLYVLAVRRLPRGEWRDVLGVALVSSMIWIAQPHAGVAWFHIPSVAMHVYGAAIAAWFVAPFRCGWQVPRAWWPVLAIAGYCVGSSSRAIATAALVGVAIMIFKLPRERRARWMWIALGGLVIGTAAGYADAPFIEFGRVVRRGLEPNLVLLKVPLESGGRLVAMIAAFVMVDLGLGALGRTRADATAMPDLGEPLRWFLASFATAIWCLFGPRYYEATFLPATCLLVIATLPFALWLATSRPLGIAIVIGVVAVHAIVWPIAVTSYHRFGAQGIARMSVLEQTKPGEVAIVTFYTPAQPTFWFPGEDLSPARLRQQVAVEAFGLRDIVISPVVRRLENNPRIEFKLDVDGASDAELRAARAPAVWSGVPPVARDQFELFVERLRAVTGKPVSARLVATNLTLVEAGARPLLGAWAEGGTIVAPRTQVSPLDENNEYTIRMYGSAIKLFDQAWVIDDGKVRTTPYRNAAPHIRPATARLNVLVFCNKDRCLVEDAFVPRF